jgi:hypothetical protein
MCRSGDHPSDSPMDWVAIAYFLLQVQLQSYKFS